VLSPYLYSLYVDELIVALRSSGFGIYVGKLFAGCIFYADDILLIACSCYRLQRMVDICGKYGHMWYIAFNISKCFGNYSQSTPAIHLNNRLVPWVSKMKYLGLFFTAWNCKTDLTNKICKYYGKLNNILFILGNRQDEMQHVQYILLTPTVGL